MKIFIFLCLAGLSLAHSSRNEWNFEPDREYVYAYSGRMLTGIPKLADVYSGIAVNCSVHIRPVSGEINSYSMAVRDPKFVRISDELAPANRQGLTNWRELRLPNLQEIPGEYRTLLLQPIQFTMTNGEITSAKFSKNEPVWSVNFKKALALQFQTKTDISKGQLENNLIFDEDHTSNNPTEINSWTVKEETIDGVCEASYEVNELPSYIINERPDIFTYPDACSTKKYFGITKTRDVGKCEKTASFSYVGIGSMDDLASGGYPNVFGRSSSTRYFACGNRGNLVIQSIVNDGELSQNPLGIRSEQFVTGTLQTFHLREITPPSNMDLVGEVVILKSMMFEHSKETFEQPREKDQLRASEEGRIPRSFLSDPTVIRQALPRNFFYGIDPSEISDAKIKEQIVSYSSEILKSLINGVDARSSEITNKVLAISRGYAMLKNRQEIKDVYENLKKSFNDNEENLVSMKNVFLSTLLNSGTSEAILIINEMIVQGEFTRNQIGHYWTFMPTYVRLPTKEVLESFYTLATSEQTRNDRFLYNKAIMGLSTLMQKACLGMERGYRYPVNVFGEFCNPDSEIVSSKWIPYLIRDLQNTHSLEQRNEMIVSLGLMKHKSIIGELLPFVQGSFPNTTELNRYLAIYSMATSADRRDSSHVESIMMSVLNNPAESTILRIAAFHVVMNMNPSLAVMHKIASLTWNCEDNELLKTINLAFFTLSRETSNEIHDENTLTLTKRASLVYPLIRKTPGIIPSSATLFTNDYLSDLDIGYDHRMSWIASNSSFIPKAFYTEISYIMNQFKVNPLAFGIRLEGSENIYQEVEQLLSKDQNDHSEVNKELKNIFNQLRVKVHENGPMDGAFYLKWFESSPIFYNFDKLSKQELRHKVSSILHDPQMLKGKICGQHPLNFQQTLDRSPIIFMIPSDLGFPIVSEIHLPVGLSVRGKIDIDCSAGLPSVTYEANVVSSAQLSGWVGTTIPFTKEYTVTGVEEKFVLSLPARVHMSLDIPSGKMSFNFSMQKQTSTSDFDIINYQVRPFVTYKQVTDLTPLTLSEGFKMIRSGNEIKNVEYPREGSSALGLRVRVATESSYVDFKSLMDIMSFYRNNPSNFLRFFWTIPALYEDNKPSLRYHEFTIIMDPSSVSEFEFDLEVGLGQKSQDQVRYHRALLKQDQLESSFNPYQSESFNINEKNVHPRRQANIKSALENLQVSKGYAITMDYSITLKGDRPFTYANSLTFAAGKEDSHGTVKSKWDLTLENSGSESMSKICVKGYVDMPVLPLWSLSDIHSALASFHYSNEVGLGKLSCSESTIKTEGTANVSKKQRDHSTKSKEARRCQELIHQQAPGAQLSNSCERARLQASSLDKIEFKTIYNNIPESFRQYESNVVDAVQMYLFPYLRSYVSKQTDSESGQAVTSSKTIIGFHQDTPSFDLTILREGKLIQFQNVRIVHPFDLVFPLKGGRDNVFLATRALTGSAPECGVGRDEVKTFDKKSMPLEMDDCFHLLSGDCSERKSFAILGRRLNTEKFRRELKVYLGDISMVLTPSDQLGELDFPPHMTVKVNDEEVRYPLNVWNDIIVGGKNYGQLLRTKDNVVQLVSKKFNAHFLFDGGRVVIYGISSMKSKLCGICGNYNQLSRDDILGPGRCAHNNPEVLLASYRIQSGNCSHLPNSIQNQLERDLQRCHTTKEIPTKVTLNIEFDNNNFTSDLNPQAEDNFSRSGIEPTQKMSSFNNCFQISDALMLQSGKCNIRRHVVIERSEDICISKQAVKECRIACKVYNNEMVQKKTQFTCMPKGRLADLYTRKAQDGKEIHELREMSTSFDAEIEQPRRCVSAIPIGNQ